MSKEQKDQQANVKKDNVSVLEKIRRRTGLLVGIVGLALVIFILESLLGSGASIFGNDEMSTVGTINGKKIDRNEFINRYENYLRSYSQQGQEVTDALRSEATESLWNQYIVELVMKPQFEKAGLMVGDDELYENVVVHPDEVVMQNITDRRTGRVNEQFSRPDGTLDPVKWKQAVQSVSGENEMAVKQMEEQVKSSLYFEKYRALVEKGLYVTKAEVAEEKKSRDNRIDFNLVMKRFDAVSDSAVKVTEDDIEEYFQQHRYRFRSMETTRSIEYVAFNVNPSEEDLAAIEKEANETAELFKGKTPSEDSVFMSNESENGQLVIQNLTKENMTLRDSSVFTSAPGTVFGPYNEGSHFKIYKLQAINSVADSARVRHILIGLQDAQTQQAKRNMQMAKHDADSVMALLKEGKASFDSLVVNYSDDLGSKTNGGDYGWYDETERFVDPFKYAGLMGVKGELKLVETEFGYHIIEVLDVAKSRHTSYRIAQILKPIAPSEETNQRVYARASQFQGENPTGEKFDQAVEKEKLAKRMAENVKEGDYSLPGLEGAKDLVRWAYTAEKGDVSIFSLPDKHVVAKVSAIRNKGQLPLEEVRAEVTRLAIQQKKAEMLKAEFTKNSGDFKNLKELASKLGVSVIEVPDFQMFNPMVPAVGKDLVVAGTAAAVKPSQTSQVTVGENGVFVLTVTGVEPGPDPQDPAVLRRELVQAIGSRADYDVYNALKEIADIEFHKSRID